MLVYSIPICTQKLSLSLLDPVPRNESQGQAGADLFKVRLHMQISFFPHGITGNCMNWEAAFHNQKLL